jgi:hypothetical protein
VSGDRLLEQEGGLLDVAAGGSNETAAARRVRERVGFVNLVVSICREILLTQSGCSSRPTRAANALSRRSGRHQASLV